MNVHKVCDIIEPIFNKYKDDEHIEMEMRLGKYNGKFFDTNIGENMLPIEHDYDSEMDCKKTKTRTSYIRKNLSIDMTSIIGGAQDMDSEDPFTYQVEFEIIKPENVEDKNTLFNIIHKIKDLFNILE